MEISELFTKVVEILETDASIEKFCQDEFQKSPKIWVGFDDDNLPEPADYPIIVIPSISRAERGDNKGYITYVLLVGVGVIGEAAEKSGKRVVYKAISQVERLRELTESAFFSSVGKLGHKIDVSGQTTSEVVFPIFSSATEIEISFLKTSRSPIK